MCNKRTATGPVPRAVYWDHHLDEAVEVGVVRGVCANPAQAFRRIGSVPSFFCEKKNAITYNNITLKLLPTRSDSSPAGRAERPANLVTFTTDALKLDFALILSVTST